MKIFLFIQCFIRLFVAQVNISNNSKVLKEENASHETGYYKCSLFINNSTSLKNKYIFLYLDFELFF